MASTATLARPKGNEETQSPRDREHVRACVAAGIEPDVPHIRQYPQVFSPPPLLFAEAVEPAIFADEVVDDVLREDERRQAVLDRKLSLFVANARSALEAGHRYAAIQMRTGDYGPAEMRARWPDLTERRLDRARRQLAALLAAEPEDA